jgi:hypothetical protein
MLNTKEYLMLCLIEELGECQKELIKCLRFGREQFCEESNSTNFERFLAEWSDLMGIIEMLRNENILIVSTSEAISRKIERTEYYMKKSINMGTLV